MAFVVLYDACVLYPAPLRDLLIRLANTGVVRARWSATILDECFRNILENRPDLKPESLVRTRELMTQAVPDCMVTNFEGLIDALVLPDVDDRHVLAAAIRAGAQAIVTFNLADFPADRLAPYNIEAKHPDDFVIDTLDISPGAVAIRRRASRHASRSRFRALRRQAARAIGSWRYLMPIKCSSPHRRRCRSESSAAS